MSDACPGAPPDIELGAVARLWSFPWQLVARGNSWETQYWRGFGAFVGKNRPSINIYL
jgi:hypothetical protein